ncbi:hypothetical protein PR048_014455 [Dryococelus australis]|uniref:Uncharacterized protein n=1 Tax=Dryococelus australis TaxID=614101 RepID=A0ABQ9HEA6_9NEOP|nr:hypothetical protein PR048_014455 [Dryococelus australis]
MDLLVDVVRQGRGTINHGNTSRRFFENPKKPAEITGVDERLIHRLSVILKTLSITSEGKEAFRRGISVLAGAACQRHEARGTRHTVGRGRVLH